MTGPFTADVVDLEVLRDRVVTWQQAGQRVALCHGCFDLLHVGHVAHLVEARLMADHLVVTVTRDAYVAKGEGRPIFTDDHRADLLAALRAVDAVALNDWPTAVPTIELLRPDVFVKGPDYRASHHPDVVAEREAALAAGAEVRYTQGAKLSSSEFLRQAAVVLGD